MEAAVMPQTSFSVFVLMPRPEKPDEFCVLREKPGRKKPGRTSAPRNLLKTPGGGVEENETLEVAARTEVLEEVGRSLRKKKLEPVLEVHKQSFDESGQAHHDIFFASEPPDPLEGSESGKEFRLGSEIAEAHWMTDEEIKRAVKLGSFHQSHGSAFWWLFIRDEYLKTRDQKLLAHFSHRGLKALTVKDEELILCLNASCEICPMGKGLEFLAKDERSDRDRRKTPIAPMPPVRPKPTETIASEESDDSKDTETPAPPRGPRTATIVLFRVGRMMHEDTLILERGAREDELRLPTKEFADPSLKGITADLVKFSPTEFVRIVRKGDHPLVAAHCKKMSFNGLVAISLNAPPPSSLFSAADRADILEAVAVYNAEPNEEKILLHPSWRPKWRKEA